MQLAVDDEATAAAEIHQLLQLFKLPEIFEKRGGLRATCYVMYRHGTSLLLVLFSACLCVVATDEVKQVKVQPGYTYKSATAACAKLKLGLCPSSALCQDGKPLDAFKATDKEEQW